MSNDDARSSVSRLFDDGEPDEEDEMCETLFGEGLLRMCPNIDDATANTAITAPSPPVHRVSSTQFRRSGVEGGSSGVVEQQNPLSTLDNSRPFTTRNNAQVGSFAASAAMDAGSGEGNQTPSVNSSQMVTRPSPNLPPLPLGSPIPPSNRTSAEVSGCDQPQSSSRRSSVERRKRSPLLVSSYYLSVWVPRRGDGTTMVQKRMCKRCKTVVQSKSQNLLMHTANCRFTPLSSKKNALDQSRNRDVPEVSLDSREGEQRETNDHAKGEDRGREARDAVLAKRPLSQSGLERDGKRRKTDSIIRRKGSRKCEPKDCAKLHMALTRAIIWHNLPFSICDRQKSYDTPFLEMLKEFKPDYPKCCKPNSDKFRNTYLPLYYNEVRERVVRCLNRSLSGTYAYGTIMFDGWEAINGNAVVNVMLRVTSSLMSGTATFFLDSVYTKDRKVDAEKYAEIIESVMVAFQGQRQSPFTGINGTVSDSARACVKAKALLASNHVGMVTIQDQAHAADLLMSDLGKLPWLEEVLSKVNTIVQALRSNRKLLSRFRDLIEEYNYEVRKNNQTSSEHVTSRPPAADVWSLLHTWELDELEHDFAVQDTDVRSNNSTVLASHEASADRAHAVRRSRNTQRTAVTIKKPVKTRFASAETMLEGYLRSRDVLKRLTRDEEFDRLYDGSRVANREKRNTTFVQVIDDDDFYSHVVDVHNIMRVIRRYLRVWDAENSQISEVVPATLLMDFSLNRIADKPFPTCDRKREVMEVLKRRCKGKTTHEGGAMQIRILQDVHYTAWLLDPNLCPVNINEFLPAFERHVRVYLGGAKSDLADTECQRVAQRLTKAYRDVHKIWDAMRKGTKNREILESYAGHALRYWEDETPAETVLKDDPPALATDLQCFARYNLSLCPSSCATERSFSHQGRIHTKQRNRLKPDVVRKLLFCKWNARVLRNLDRIQFDKDEDKDKLKLGAMHPYEDFLSKPVLSSIFSDTESADLLKRITTREHRTQEQIKSARGMLYNYPQVYIYAGVRSEPNAASLRTLATTEAPALSHSAHDSVHGGSTTLGVELSAKTKSPSSADEPRTYHATNTEELTELLSASKTHSAARSRTEKAPEIATIPFELPEDTVDDMDTAIENAALSPTLRDDDNITISVATAREMLRSQRAPRASAFAEKSGVFNGQKQTVLRSQPGTSLSHEREPTHALNPHAPRMGVVIQESRPNAPGVEGPERHPNLSLPRTLRRSSDSRSSGRSRGRAKMCYFPGSQRVPSQTVEDEEDEDQADLEISWEEEEDL